MNYGVAAIHYVFSSYKFSGIIRNNVNYQFKFKII